MFNDCVIKIISSDAESREEQDGSKFFCRMNDGRVTGHFVSICNEKHGKEAKTKDFSLTEEGSFPCKLR